MVVDFPVSWSVCSMVTRMLQPHSHSSSRNGGLLSPRMCTHDTIILTVSIRRLAVATTDMYGVGADFELHLRRVTPNHKMATLRFFSNFKTSGTSTVALRRVNSCTHVAFRNARRSEAGVSCSRSVAHSWPTMGLLPSLLMISLL